MPSYRRVVLAAWVTGAAGASLRAPLPAPRGCSAPCVERIEVVATGAAPDDDDRGGAGDAWGGHQSRIVRTTKDEVFVSYLVAGTAHYKAEWRVARRSAGTWRVVGRGIAGREPASLLKTPDDKLLVIAWPGDGPELSIGRIAGDSVIWTHEAIPGPWVQMNGATYLGAGISARGRLCVVEAADRSGLSRPAHVIACRDDRPDAAWSTARRDLHDRYAYPFVLPTDSALFYVASRDVLWSQIGLVRPSASVPAYVFNAVRLWSEPTIRSSIVDDHFVLVRQELPSRRDEYVMAHPLDFMLERGRAHVLYNVVGPSTAGRNQQREALVQNGQLLWDVLLPSPVPSVYAFHRLVSDADGRLYWLFGSDTIVALFQSTSEDGRSFGPQRSLPIGNHRIAYAGIFVAAPRGGTPWTSFVDVVFPDRGDVVYARIRLSSH